MSGKKAEQRRIREEKQAAARRRNAVSGMAWKIGIAVFLVLAVIVFARNIFFGPETLPPDRVGAGDHVRGADDAPVTLTVYADFQCPACLAETNLITRAWPQIANQVRLVFRHYPLDTHRHAFLAARYAEAAAEQGAFWDMHDLLFVNQALWSTAADVTEVFDGYARQLGLDVERLKADVNTPAIRDKILADQRGGTRAGVRGTPALFLNGRPISNPRTAPELTALIRRAAEEVR